MTPTLILLAPESYNFTLTSNNTNAGYFTATGTYSFTGSVDSYTGPGFRKSGVGGVWLSYDYTAHPNNDFDFQYWLTDDGSLPPVTGTTTLHGLNHEIFRDTTFIAWYAPTGDKIVRLNWPYPANSGGTWTSGDLRSFTVNQGTEYQNTFYYHYSSDNATITAKPNDGYKFIGWYDNFKSIDAPGTLICPSTSFNVGSATRNLNLTPVFEADDGYCNVYFDGSNGITASAVMGKDIAHGANTLFASIDGNGYHGGESVLQRVQRNTTITLPTTATPPQGNEYNHFTLYGWYMLPEPGQSGSQGHYYHPGASVTITRDTVFYADWFASSYDIGQPIDVFNPELSDNKGIVYPDTSSFIKTDVFDYNTLFNMQSLILDTDSTISRLGNYEYWKRNSVGTRDFLFISAVSDEMRTLSARERKTDWRNQNHELSRAGDIYAGIAYQGILSTSGLQDALFNTTQYELGKKYVGRGDNLYLYDTTNGYYYYDSDKNAASFNQSAHRFYVYNYTNCTNKSLEEGGNDKTDFLPFNYGEKSGGYIERLGEPNYWFGMKSEIDFFLPNATGYQDENENYGNQSTHGHDMVFKFCGDDDVWIFVDGQLYLDLGGVHGKVYGEINFSRGTTTIAQFGAGKTDVDNIMSYSAESVGQYGDDTSIGGPTNYGDHRLIIPGTINLDEGDHKVTIYYLERGSSQSNCAIYFNLAPRYRLKMHKEDNSTSAPLEGATFGVYSDEACTLAANVWDTSTGTKTSIFTTDSNGYIDISGFIAGHAYFLKELVAPPGYPDLSEEVITLSLNSLGGAEVSSTADVEASDNNAAWTMASVTSSETTSSTRGMFLLNMTVKNRQEVSITAKKVWALLGGGQYTRNENSSVTVKLQRYSLTSDSSGSSEGNTETTNFNVRLITRYFTDGAKPTNRDTGGITELGLNSYIISKGGSLSFSVPAPESGATEKAGIHSVASQFGTISSNYSNYTKIKKYYVNGGWTFLPQSGSFTLSNIQRDTDIYITFIGSADTVSDLGISILEGIPANSSGVNYSKVQDTEFNESETTVNNQALEVTLDKNNGWETTWTGLLGSANNTQYYYYVKEISVSDSMLSHQYLTSIPAYVQTFSSDGLTGGNITVRNTVNAIKVELRKKDATNDNPLGGAEFKIYTAAEYVGHENDLPENPVVGTNASYWLETNTYNASKKAFVSEPEQGWFYRGYLPIGKYYVVETKAPDGYNSLTSPVIVEVSEDKFSYVINDRPTNVSLSSQKEYYNVYVPNNPGVVLPATGGPGTKGLYLLGEFLTVVSFTGLLTRKKKRRY